MKRILVFPLLIAWLVACDTNGTNATSEGSSSSSGGSVSMLPPLCELPGGPYTPSPLCGPKEAPCKVLVNELVPVPAAAFRRDTPGLTLDSSCLPQVIAIDGNADQASLALRGGKGEWSVSPVPFVVSTVGLTLAPSGTSLVLASDGPLNTSSTSHWVYDGKWHQYSEIPAKGMFDGNGFAIGKDYQLFATLLDDAGALLLANFQFMQGWKVETIGSASSTGPLAVSPDGSPHVIAWHNPNNGPWELSWYAPPLEREVALLYGSTGINVEAFPTALAVSAKDDANPQGKPHILAMRRDAVGDELVYVTREGSQAFTVTPVEQPPADRKLHPLGVVTDEMGNVRLFYSRRTSYAPELGEFVMAWPDGKSGVSSVVLASGFSPFIARFARDGAGRVHVATYEYDEAFTYPVRYLVLGP